MGKNMITPYAALGVGLAVVLTFGLTAISNVMEQPSESQLITSQPAIAPMVPALPAPEEKLALEAKLPPAPRESSEAQYGAGAPPEAPAFEKPAMMPEAAKMDVSITYPIKITKSGLIDQLGNVLRSSDVDVPVGIEAQLQNTSPEKLIMIYIVQVKNSDGITVFLTWIRDFPLPPDEGARPTVFWTPSESGRYSIEVFVWNSNIEAGPLSSAIRMSIQIT